MLLLSFMERLLLGVRIVLNAKELTNKHAVQWIVFALFARIVASAWIKQFPIRRLVSQKDVGQRMVAQIFCACLCLVLRHRAVNMIQGQME